jgi:hypothetical protein
MKINNPYVLALGAFLAAWSATNFDIDYRAVLLAIVSGIFGYATPKR